MEQGGTERTCYTIIIKSTFLMVTPDKFDNAEFSLQA